jgi:hypothetical protein
VTEKEKIDLAHWEGYVQGREYGWKSAIIDAAEIAKTRHEHWSGNDVSCDVTACEDIEKQILALLEKFK